MTALTWLHLSDWHQKGTNFDQTVVRDELIQDIVSRARIDPDLKQIDFIVFSGDLAFSGHSDEYKVVQKELLDPILSATGLPANRLFCVPGNHDLSRDTIRDFLPVELQKPLDNHALVQKWLTDVRRRGPVLEPFEAYRKFISGYTGQPSPDYASTLWLEIEGKKIVLLGLNSAWMCGRNQDARGLINDLGYTLVGEPQIHSALVQAGDADLRIAILHHPFEFLSQFDRNRVESQLQSKVHFILRGHEHTPKVSVLKSTAGNCVIIPAGASYDQRTPDDPRHTNAYNYVHINFDEQNGTVYLRRWSDPRNEWVADTDTDPHGKYPFSLPMIQNLPGPSSSPGLSGLSNPPIPSSPPGLRSRLSDRLSINYYLNPQFKTFQEKWLELTGAFVLLPGLMKNWREYCESIDQIASNLIPQDWSSEDIFVLCCAIYLHKIGLMPNNSSSQQYRHIFEQHPLISKNYIVSFGSTLNLDKTQIQDIAWVCYAQRDFIKANKATIDTLSLPELLQKTKGGRKTRAEIAYCLRILQKLGSFNSTLPEIAANFYFKDTSAADYLEFRMNSVVAGFELQLPPESTEHLILLKAQLSEADPVNDIRYLQKAREQLEDTFRKCPSNSLGNFFANATVNLDYDILAQEIGKIVVKPGFNKVLQDAMRKSTEALLNARYDLDGSLLKGWGPMIFYPRDATPPSSTIPKEVQETRVANTAEVILAFTGWLEIATPQEDSVQKVINAINLAIPSLQYARANNVSGVSSHSAKTAKGKYNPLTSLTFGVPTTRANSLYVLAATHLLMEMEKHPHVYTCKDDAYPLTRDCIEWLCSTNTGPFNDRNIEFLPNEYIFQLILGFKALINSKKYWMDLNIGFDYDKVLQKVANFVHSFVQRHKSERGWPLPVFKAMVLEILLFYSSQNDTLRFNQKQSVERLIKNIFQELLDGVNLINSPPWPDDNQTLSDEGNRNARPWTHVTSAWALEGLARCAAAQMLTPEQKDKLLQTIPWVLLKQDRYGFYDSERHPDDPEAITIHHIFKTALYTYALAQVYKILL